MRQNHLFRNGYFLATICCLLQLPVFADKVKLTTSPSHARIYVNGIITAAGSAVITIPKHQCLTVEIKAEGYVPETRVYCNKKGADHPAAEFIQLKEDECFTGTEHSDSANFDVPLEVKAGKPREEAWRQLVTTVLTRFDQLESNDDKAGYLRSSWVGFAFKTNTVRVRIIIKQNPYEPLAFKVKFMAEESGKPGTPFNADEQYRPFNRIPKRYNGFMEELTVRLRN